MKDKSTFNTTNSIPCGHFHLKDGFPDEYYAFTDGEISATVERNGGINSLKVLDIFECDGKLYPDRGGTPILFLKEGNQCGKRPLYGPAVQFISTNVLESGKKGRNLFHVPDRVELYPFGFRSESMRFGHRTTYDMAINGRKILFSFTNEFPLRKDLVISINKDHIFQGKTFTEKNMMTDAVEAPKDIPFRENHSYEQRWDFIGYDAALNGLVLEGTMRFLYGDKGVVVLLSSDKKARFSETKGRYYLTIPWEDAVRIKLCLTLAESREDAGLHSQEALADLDSIFRVMERESIEYSASSTLLKAEEFAQLETLSRTAPSFLKAMVLAETEKEACVRAATHKFGYFPAWDHLFPAQAFVLMGHGNMAKKLLRYYLTLPSVKYFCPEMICPVFEDYISISGDINFLREMYPALTKLFYWIQSKASSDNGLIAGRGTYGCDDPKELGIYHDILAPCANGWWYNTCRAMENMALLLGDDEVAKAAAGTGQNINTHFLSTFYDKTLGYLYSSVDPETGKGMEIYQNVSTQAMHFPYGESLLYPRIREIADFQAYQLYHPAGRSAVAFRDDADEMWKNCIMYQHIAHEMKTARAAGLGDEITRMMKVYLGHFHRNKVLIETHNLVGAHGDISQRANWQAFCARTVFAGVFESLIGIQYDLGGFNYVPCDMSGRMSISEFKFRNGVWNITIDGEGAYAEDLVLDGKPVAGTMKVPAVYFEDNQPHTLAITRSRLPFRRPTLLSAVGASITNLESGKDRLSFGVKNKAHATCKVYCPEKPVVTLAGREIAFDWRKDTNVAWIDLVMEQEQTLLMKL